MGTLPFAVGEASNGDRVINSLPWYGSHGGCWLESAGDHSARAALISAYRAEIRERAPIFAITILSPWEEPFSQDYSEGLGQTIVDHRIGQIGIIPAEQDDLEATLAAMLRQKTRNLVRKACRQGFEEVVGDYDESWSYLYTTHQENMGTVGGKPKPLSHFEALRKHFSGGYARLSLACLNGQPVAGLLLLKFAQTVEYLVPVVTLEYRSQQPLSFLIWNAMLQCAREGYRHWNWGGTWPSQHTLHHFKAGWGAKALPYSYLGCATPKGLSRFRNHTVDMLAEFPFFYLYPLDRTLERHTA